MLNGDFRNGNLMIGRDGVRAVVETWAGSASIPGATAAWRGSSVALATREDRPLIPMKLRLIKPQRLGRQPKQPGPIPGPERPKHFET